MVSYEKEFKEQAIKMAAEVGATKAAQDLGVHVNTLYTWISRSKQVLEEEMKTVITMEYGEYS